MKKQRLILTPKQALDSTKRVQYINESVLESFPTAVGRAPVFFRLDKYVTAKELDKEYAKRKLIPSPMDLCAFDVSNPQMMDEKEYVATQWKDAEGNFCCLSFDRWRGGRRVRVLRDGRGWGDGWWFGGVPVAGKSSELESSALSSDSLTLELSEAVRVVKEAGCVIYKQV